MKTKKQHETPSSPSQRLCVSLDEPQLCVAVKPAEVIRVTRTDGGRTVNPKNIQLIKV